MNDQKEAFFFFSLPDVFQELVELESRKLGESATGERQLGWAKLYMSLESNQKVAPKNQTHQLEQLEDSTHKSSLTRVVKY